MHHSEAAFEEACGLSSSVLVILTHFQQKANPKLKEMKYENAHLLPVME